MGKKKTNGKDPAVLLYTQDFIVGTLTMTHEERGKYILLLCMQHQKGKLTLKDLKSVLSDDDIDIAERFPLHADGYYYNDRMQMEIENRKIKTDSSRNNGSKGGRPKTTILPGDEPNNNLTETHRLSLGKPINNPTGTGNETGNEIEDDNDNDSGVADGTATPGVKLPSYKFCYEVYNELISLINTQEEFSDNLEAAEKQIGWDNFRKILGLSDTKWDELKKILNERVNNY